MNYLKKIKAISKISVKKTCEELKINRSNLLNGNSTNENEKKVYNELINKYETIKRK